MRNVQIFDTTLRDGEQSPGISLSVEEKVEIAHQLARLKVDVIEAGFPITSEGDFESVSRIASEVRGPTIAGTVGYTTPGEFSAFLKELQERVPGLADRVLSVHCHDDLGLAVANSLAGVQVGARQIEVAVNGLGERAGNASLEEIVMALVTRGDHYDVEVGVDSRQLANTSRLVSNVTGYEVPPNKAVVGRNAFLHESGIHQDGVLKDRRTFEIMTPKDIGLEGTNIFLGKHSGRHALKDALEELGYTLEGEVLKRAFARF